MTEDGQLPSKSVTVHVNLYAEQYSALKDIPMHVSIKAQSLHSYALIRQKQTAINTSTPVRCKM